MKKILIIEDNQIVATVYRNRFNAEGYQAEIALDGETGLQLLRTFQPDLLVLDLLLPKMSGVDVIRQIRGQAEFARLPIIVFSNTYLTSLIQEAWKAGANKCLSKAGSSPQELLEIVRRAIGGEGAAREHSKKDAAPNKARALTDAGVQDAIFHADLQKSFIDGLPATLAALRDGLQDVVSAGGEKAQRKQVYELCRRLHALTGNAGIACLPQISRMSDAVEALLKELYEKPEGINSSTLRTVAGGVDVLGLLFDRGAAPGTPEMAAGDVLVVDDEAISRRAITYALEKAQLRAVTAEDPATALKLLEEGSFELVVLDVELPGMTGYELCAKMRALPRHAKTAVVFVTVLSEFDEHARTPVAGGDDFIAKPFLFIELTVKALVHVLRARLQSAA
jgi:DNA-binding response OmpR family regulator